MNMFAQNSASSISEYLANLPAERKEAVEFLHDFIQKSAPEFRPNFASNMLGYGSFTYIDSKKKQQTWPVIALANQKNYISIYVCAVVDGKYVAESHAAELGKVSVGKSCIRFKKVDDLNLEVLDKVLKLATKYPGLDVGR